MAQLKCGFCQGTSFALSTEQPSGARYPLAVVRCGSCDNPVGVLQREDPSETIRAAASNLSAAIGQIGAGLARDVDQLKKDLAEILRRLQAPSIP